jgi:hypothetical protein
MSAIANARMTRALRSVSSEKGRDPREFALIAYGGAGPVHAVGLAEDLGCRTVLVPALAGLFSSLGLLYARPEFHVVRTCHLDARTVDPAALDAVFAELAASLEGVELVRSAELRYGGQTWEIEIEVGDPVDLRSVIAMHLTRFIGIYFLVLYARGLLPFDFAVLGGWGDIAIAATAVLWLVLTREPAAHRGLLLLWNLCGLVDILFVIATAARMAAADPASMGPLRTLPLSLLPTFLVPLIIASHVLIFWRLGRAARPAV